eukprot:4994860-Pleurochrysis_carterae.AAC.1
MHAARMLVGIVTCMWGLAAALRVYAKPLPGHTGTAVPVHHVLCAPPPSPLDVCDLRAISRGSLQDLRIIA